MIKRSAHCADFQLTSSASMILLALRMVPQHLSCHIAFYIFIYGYIHHRVPEWFGFEGTLKSIWDTFHQNLKIYKCRTLKIFQISKSSLPPAVVTNHIILRLSKI